MLPNGIEDRLEIESLQSSEWVKHAHDDVDAVRYGSEGSHRLTLGASGLF